MKKVFQAFIKRPLVNKLSNKITTNKLIKKLIEFQNKRNHNSDHYKMTNFFITLLFPIFIVSISEINQMKYVSNFILFVVNRPSVMIFNVFIATTIFWALIFIFKKIWFAIAVHGVSYFALSIVELFKYGTNGNHLLVMDVKLFRSIKSLSSFAYIKITPLLVTYSIILLTFIIISFWFNPTVNINIKKRLITSTTCLAIFASIIFIPTISHPIFNFFKVDTTYASNVFKLNEKFENNSFLAFIVETTNASISDKLTTPNEYNEEVIEDYMSLKIDEQISSSNFKKPNVIVVMSEAFADFRAFENLNLETNAYDKFDKIRNSPQSYAGKTIVPTFASFTVRTEFELIFGLPVKSLKDPNMPQRLLIEREQPTILQYYKSLGYETAYVHPFLGSFYSRKRLYPYLGFNQLLFDDSLTVPVEYYGSYIKDSVVFDQIEKLINETESPLYVHTTTMQNHQPYNYGDTPEDEFNNYLTNLSVTAEDLEVFINNLNKIDEPTIVFFTGDHFPSLKAENNKYNDLGINSENCGVVYEQSYFIWNNYGLSYDKMPTNNFSTFYVPYVIYDLIDAPKDNFISLMLDKLSKKPIYSTQYDSTIPNDSELDVLTYDRILGEHLSTNEEIMEKEVEDLDE